MGWFLPTDREKGLYSESVTLSSKGKIGNGKFLGIIRTSPQNINMSQQQCFRPARTSSGAQHASDVKHACASSTSAPPPGCSNRNRYETRSGDRYGDLTKNGEKTCYHHLLLYVRGIYYGKSVQLLYQVPSTTEKKRVIIIYCACRY